MTGFPKHFLWGVATSAYQIEGSPLADGAGPSNWHRFTHAENSRVPHRQNGDVACDHYRRWKEDISLMRDLGLNAYRFSLSWSRILPAGKGIPNPGGLDFYSRLVDGLLDAGIQPLVTLYHWDLPAALEDLGGWLNPQVADWFAEYAHLACSILGDRVTHWATLNEPWVVSHEGHLTGAHAPGHRSPEEVPVVSHNLLRAHGAGVRACRAAGARTVGLVVNLEPKYAATDRPEDVAAAGRADAYMNRQFLDPVFLGRYPSELPLIFGKAWPDHPATDFSLIREPIDFLGINYYTRSINRFDPDAPLGQWSSIPARGRLRTEMDWEVYPDGLTEILLWIRKRYGDVPLLVTENGAAFHDPCRVSQDVDDPLRVEYLRSHLVAVQAALQAGVDVRGYCAWSLLDNFEWACGYTKTFGLVHVDGHTQDRTPKTSFRFFADVIRSRGASLFA